MAKQKDPNKRKFSDTRVKARNANTDYNSIMDEYRRNYRYVKKHKFEATREELWSIVLRMFKEAYGVKIEDIFIGNIFEAKLGGKKFGFKIEDYTKGKYVRFVRIDKDSVYGTSLEVADTFGSKKSKFILIENTYQKITIQGFDGQLEKSLFRINVRKQFKVWKKGIQDKLDKLRKTNS